MMILQASLSPSACVRAGVVLATLALTHGCASTGEARGGLTLVGSEPAASPTMPAAEEVSADLIVVGTHGRTGIASFLLGSVAQGVLHAADRDVLTVPAHRD